VAKWRFDSFRLRGTGSMCHMFSLNVEFSNACRFRVFQCHFSTVSRFPFPRFQLPQCWHGRTEYWKLPAFLPNIQNVLTNFSCWQCLCTILGPISLLYKQLLQYMLLKSFTVPSALLTKFPKKFHMKRLASNIIFTKLSTKTLLLWRCHVSFRAVGRRRHAAAADILLTPPPPIITDRRAAAAAADRMSASRRRRFRKVFTSRCTTAICC